jgi:monothiol bacilliredoxin
MNALKELKSADDLDLALKQSSTVPLLLFKHSATCSISDRAFREVETLVQAANHNVDVNLVTVQRSPGVSARIESLLGVEHESPQAILVRDGLVVWHASHFAITVSSVAEALRDLERDRNRGGAGIPSESVPPII